MRKGRSKKEHVNNYTFPPCSTPLLSLPSPPTQVPPPDPVMGARFGVQPQAARCFILGRSASEMIAADALWLP